MKLLSLILAASVASTLASCPNKCSGHGSCGSADKCACQPRWTGQDCSLRECPFGLSWTAEGDGSVPAGGGLGGLHPYAECSGKGACDRSTGECGCFPGYEGRGCRRERCPNDCSGNGRCVSNTAATSTYVATGAAKFSSQFWDATMTRVCACDRGWEGYDCSSRICPKGDDPVTDCGTGGSNNSNSLAHNQVQRLWVATVDYSGNRQCRAESKGYCAQNSSDLAEDNGDAVAAACHHAAQTAAECAACLDALGADTPGDWVHVTATHTAVDDTDTTADESTYSVYNAVGAGPTGGMYGYPRLDQTIGFCTGADDAEVYGTDHVTACTAAAGTGVWTANACAMGANADVLTAPAIDEIAGTFGSAVYSSASVAFFGYISLKYTDMFGGEYFTRPILMDVSTAATQNSAQVQGSHQWETTKNDMYYASGRNNNKRVAGVCTDDTSQKSQKACEAKGKTWAPSTTGFYLDGASASTHASLVSDAMRKTHLKRFTADRIRDALQDLPNFAIPSVNVTNYMDPVSGTAWGNAFDITFTDAATSGKQNLLECIFDASGTERSCDGAQPKMMASMSTVKLAASKTSSITGNTQTYECAVFEVPLASGQDYEEHSECSNRGLCDGSSGICTCFEGHTGENCATQTIFF